MFHRSDRQDVAAIAQQDPLHHGDRSDDRVPYNPSGEMYMMLASNLGETHGEMTCG